MVCKYWPSTQSNSIIQQQSTHCRLTNVCGTHQHTDRTPIVIFFSLDPQLLQCSMCIQIHHHWCLLTCVWINLHFALNLYAASLKGEDCKFGTSCELIFCIYNHLCSKNFR